MSDIEPVHQQNSEIPVIVDESEFTIELQNYYRARNENSKKLEWKNQRIQSVIDLLEEYRTIKSQGGRVKNKHYHYAKKYDIMNIDNQKVLIMKRKDITDPVVQIIPTEEYYQKILDAHIATGHGRRDKIVHALKDKYVVPIFAVLIFINLCKTCLSKKNCPKKGKVVNPLISNDFNSRGQMDLVDFMCENERNIKQEGTQSHINLKRVADKTKSTSSKKFKDISTGSTVSVLNVGVGPLNSKNLTGKVLLKKNKLYQDGPASGIDEDRMFQNAVLYSPNEEVLGDNLKLVHEVTIKPDPDAPEQEEENKLGNEDIDGSGSSTYEENIDFNNIVPILRDMSSCLQTIANKYDDSFDSFSKFVATTLRNMPQQSSEELQRQILNLLVAHLNKNKLNNDAGGKSLS